MREAMIVLAFTATCLFSSPGRAQDTTAPQVKSQLERGYRLRAAHRSSEAVAAFNRVLAADPQNHAALVELGYLHASLKQWPSAVKYLGAASEQDPSNMRLHMDLGYALQAEKQYAAAGVEFSAVAKDGGEFQAQAQKALETLKSATASAADEAEAKQRRLLQDGYAALRRGDRSSARRKFEEAVKSDPKSAPAQKQLGFIDLEAGKPEEAASHFEAARAVDPNDYFIALQLGYTYQRLKKQEAARDAFNAAAASSDPRIRDAAVAALNPAQEAAASASAIPPL
ncbi:MAG: tetratricopeptide repeat protein [Elusimicrobiota bacterium]